MKKTDQPLDEQFLSLFPYSNYLSQDDCFSIMIQFFVDSLTVDQNPHYVQ